MTRSSFPTRDFAQTMRVLHPEAKVSVGYMRENYAEIKIGVDSLTVEHISLYPKYDTLKTISGTGGVIGLLLGGSLVTLFELLEFLALLVDTFWHSFRTCFTSSKIPK